MTPALRFLERRLSPALARLFLMLTYAALLIAIAVLVGYGGLDPIIYLDVR
jgi:hypothetical protein